MGQEEKAADPHAYHLFSPVADPFPYKEAIEDTFVPRKEVIQYKYSITFLLDSNNQ